MLFPAHYGFTQTSGNDSGWYEIEVSIFSNEAADPSTMELLQPGAVILQYPEKLTLLQSREGALAYDFRQSVDEVVANDMGPPNSPATRTFHLPTDSDSAYVRLPEESERFREYNQRLQNSFQYQILWHGRWRQPVPVSSRATAVAVGGGDVFGEHHELEGHLTVSRNGNRINVAADLWRAHFELSSATEEVLPDPASSFSSFNFLSGEFEQGELSGEFEQGEVDDEVAEVYWELPPSPVPVPESSQETDTEPAAPSQQAPQHQGLFSIFSATEDTTEPVEDVEEEWEVTRVDVLREVRAMVSNKLHYLDHPALGVLIEVRPKGASE